MLWALREGLQVLPSPAHPGLPLPSLPRPLTGLAETGDLNTLHTWLVPAAEGVLGSVDVPAKGPLPYKPLQSGKGLGQTHGALETASLLLSEAQDSPRDCCSQSWWDRLPATSSAAPGPG